MAKVETAFAKKVDQYLNTKKPNIYFFNTFGNAVQRAGLPDRIVCYKGRFIGIELKRPDGKGTESKRQEIEGNKIKKAKGIFVCTDNLDFIKEIFDYIDKSTSV